MIFFFTKTGTFTSKRTDLSILINVQRDAAIFSLYFTLLFYQSTRFRSRPHPSSGVDKTVVTATGTSHIICAATSLRRGHGSK